MVKHGNFWFSTQKINFGATAGLPKHVDIAIIGGGIAGYTLLFDLVTNTAASVVLLEQASPAFHASGRNIGHISEEGPLPIDNDDAKSLYFEGIRLNNEWIRNTVKAEKIDCNYSKPGGIYIECGPKPNCEPLNKKELRSIIPTKNFEKAVYVPGEAVINPFKYINGLHDQFSNNVLLNSSVQKVIRGSNKLKIYVRDRGSFTANVVIYCTGCYTIDLLRSFKDKITLWKTHVVGSGPIKDDLLRDCSRQTIIHLDKKTRIVGKHILASGGITSVKNPACDGIIEQSVFQQLNSWWRSVFTSIPKTIPTNSVWSYVNCTGKDGLPLIGPIKDRPGEYINVGSDLNFSFVAAFILRSYLMDIVSDNDRWSIFNPNRTGL
jgi:glycine/D-amino acid oxidase-like deaminating enzyme